jgi:hypothetical protein
LRPSLARGPCEPLAYGRVGGVDVPDATALGIFEGDEPDRWELCLARIVEDERDDVVFVAERSQRRFEVDVEKVRDHEHDVPLLRDVREVVGHARDLGPGAARLGEKELAYHVEQVMTPLLRRDELPHPVREEDESDAVVVVQSRHREERRDVRGQLALRRAPRPEPSARGDVDRDVDVELALLAVFLDVRRVHPGGDIPVDGPDVVAGLVLADLFEIQPGATEDAAIGAHERFVGEDPRLDLDLFDHPEDFGWHRLALRPGRERGGHR